MARFSKKDYTMVASVMYHRRYTVSDNEMAGRYTSNESFIVRANLDAVVDEFSTIFKTDNPRFDVLRFHEAALYGKGK